MSIPKTQIFVRKARRRDRHDIDTVNRQCLPVGYSVSEWERMIEHGLSVVAVDNTGQIAGYLVATPAQDPELKQQTACIVSLAVRPAARRAGLGRKMLTMCFQLVRDKEYKNVILRVQTGNSSAIKLYQSVGFSIEHRLPNYYKGSLASDDVNFDAYQMSLMIS